MFATVHTYTQMKLFNVIIMANKIKTSNNSRPLAGSNRFVVDRRNWPCSASSTKEPQP